jgi:predicted CoA-binding protein
LRRILGGLQARLRSWACRPQWHRPSFFAAKYMQAHGYRIVPVNPTRAGDPRRAHIDMVDCFRKSEDIPPLAEEAIAIGARCLWLQLGVSHPKPPKNARAAAGLMVVADRCVKIEHARLFGGLGWAGVDTKVISSHRPQNLPY